MAKDDAQSVVRHECLPRLDRVLSKLDHLEAFNVGSATHAHEGTSEVLALGMVNRSLFWRADHSSDVGLARSIWETRVAHLIQSDMAIPNRTQALANRATVAADEDIGRLLVAL